MIVLGGRTNSVGENVLMEIYETENSEWKKFNSIQRFRHTIWAHDYTTIYMHGGFENETPNIPTNSIMKLDLLAHVKGHAGLVAKLESAFQNQYKNGANPNNQGIKTDSQAATGPGGRPITPPMHSLTKSNMKIQMGTTEIERSKGQPL